MREISPKKISILIKFKKKLRNFDLPMLTVALNRNQKNGFVFVIALKQPLTSKMLVDQITSDSKTKKRNLWHSCRGGINILCHRQLLKREKYLTSHDEFENYLMFAKKRLQI